VTAPASSELVLEYVRAHPYVTSQEIASGLGWSGPAVRYHLRKLSQMGQIETLAETTIKEQERGRPARQYRLASQLQPNNLVLLCCLLIRANSNAPGKLWADLAVGLLDHMTLPASPIQRLARLVQALEKMNYAARWEAGPHGPRIRFGNCPYATIWEEFPLLCRMDQELLERALGRPFQQTARITRGEAHKNQCIFEQRKA
jgi:predicted ArsR family transcriptional regulator